MSVINKMLQDLDRRQALGAGPESSVVRATNSKPGTREWFWRCLVLLLAVTLAWMGWVAIQLMPRKPLVTELAFRAAADAQSRAKPAPAQVPAPVETAPAPAQAAPAPLPEPKPEEKVAEASPPAPAEPLRLALQLETPVQEKAAEPARPAPPKAAKTKASRPAAERAEKTDTSVRAPAVTESAQAHFRRAGIFLSHGWEGDAEAQLVAALRADPAHAAAREGYVALLLKQQRTSVAHRVLREGLAHHPGHRAFALDLARIHAGQREYGSALEVLDRAGPAAGDAELQAMRAAMLQRLGRHPEAVEAYQDAMRSGTQPASAWIGLGTSLEALGRRSDAVLAYRRALNSSPLAAEAREFAEGRARALE